VIILTAFNSAFAEIGELCVASLRKYQSIRPHINVVKESIPDDYDRPASWYKLGLIRKHLTGSGFVLWIDADAMIVGRQDLTRLIKPKTLNISKDCNGINCGVMAWRDVPEAHAALSRMDELYSQYENHPWFEQAALMSFEHEVQIFYQAKKVFNAYPSDRTIATQIMHWPGMSIEERLPLMRKELKA